MQRLPYRRRALLLALTLSLLAVPIPGMADHSTRLVTAQAVGTYEATHSGTCAARSSSEGLGALDIEAHGTAVSADQHASVVLGEGPLVFCADQYLDDVSDFDGTGTGTFNVYTDSGWESIELGDLAAAYWPAGPSRAWGTYQRQLTDGSYENGLFEMLLWTTLQADSGHLTGQFTLTPTSLTPASDSGAACSDPATQVWWDEYNVGSGDSRAHLRVDVHQTDDEVQVCTRSSRGSSPVFNHDLIVPTDPDVNPGPPPVTVDGNAPAGDGTGSPCNEQVASKGGNPETYVRKSSGSGTPATVCIGARTGGAERHVRIAIG